MVQRRYATSLKRYRPVVLAAMKEFLPPELFRDWRCSSRVWGVWKLVLAAVLWAWEGGGAVPQRFTAVYLTLRQRWPKKQVGATYQGFIKALLRWSPGLLEVVTGALRGVMQVTAGRHWRRQGWVAFAVDGSRLECPRTAANEAALGCAGRTKSGPQLFLTTLYHLGLGLPWAFRLGPGTDSERRQLREMLGLLPALALLVADAGFMGYELLAALLGAGQHVLFRVGGNVRLLKKLGQALVEGDDTVYLWPQEQQRHVASPVVLRLIVLGRGPRKLYLVTDLPAAALSQEQAEVLYLLRWGVELFYRSLKQTLEHRRLSSRAPRQAWCEASWSVVGLWLLGLSVALALRQVRLALRQGRRAVNGRWLLKKLGRALKDSYRRTASKKARCWPHKKKERPPGRPQILIATEEQVRLAQKVRAATMAA